MEAKFTSVKIKSSIQRSKNVSAQLYRVHATSGY